MLYKAVATVLIVAAGAFIASVVLTFFQTFAAQGSDIRDAKSDALTGLMREKADREVAIAKLRDELSTSFDELKRRLDTPLGEDQAMEKLVASIRDAHFSLVDHPLDNTNASLRDILDSQFRSMDRHLRVANAYENYVLSAIAVDTRRILRKVSISFITPETADSLIFQVRMLQELLPEIHGPRPSEQDTTPDDYIPRSDEMDFVRRLLSGLLHFNELQKLGAPVASELPTTSSQRRVLLGKARAAWEPLAVAWAEIDAQSRTTRPRHCRFLSEIDSDNASSRPIRNINIGAYIANALGVIFLHEVRQRHELADQQTFQKSYNESDEELLAHCAKLFAKATRYDGGDPNLSIAYSNHAVILGYDFERTFKSVQARFTDDPTKLRRDADQQYKDGVRLLRQSLTSVPPGNTPALTRSICFNNLAMWHLVRAKLEVELAKLEVAKNWPAYFTRTTDPLSESSRRRAELLRIIRLARACINESQAAVDVPAAAFVTDMELLALETMIGANLEDPSLSGESFAARTLARFFQSMSAANARGIKKVMELQREDLAEALSLDRGARQNPPGFFDFRPILSLISVPEDEKGSGDTNVHLYRVQVLLSRIGICLNW